MAPDLRTIPEARVPKYASPPRPHESRAPRPPSLTYYANLCDKGQPTSLALSDLRDKKEVTCMSETAETAATTPAPVPGSPDYPLHSEKTIGAYFRDQVAVRSRPRVRGVPGPRAALDVPRLRRAHRQPGARASGHRHAPGRPLGRVGAQHPRLAHVHVRHGEDRRGHGHGEPRLQEPRAGLRAQAVRHEGALRHRRLPRRGLPADHPRARARDRSPSSAATWSPRTTPASRTIIYMGPEKHRGCYSVPELLLLGQHVPGRRAARRPRPTSTTTAWS